MVRITPKKLLPLAPYIGAILIQGIAWAFALRGNTYITNYQSSSGQCPTTNKFADAVIALSILSALAMIYGLIVVIRKKQVYKIIGVSVLILLLGFSSFAAFVFAALCFTF
jgi:uncharacterized membrane protein